MSSSPLYAVGAGQMVAAGLVGFLVSFGLGYLLSILASFGFFLLWGGLLAGGAVAEVILRAAGRKRGVKIEALTAIVVIAGLAASTALWYFRTVVPDLPPGATFEVVIQQHAYFLAAMVIMVFSAVSRVRFL